MRCPNCGAEIPNGYLYCEQCGDDIHIVPDFEPEVELNIEQTISGIAEEIKESHNEDENIRRKKIDSQKRLSLRNGLLLSVIFGVVCLILVVAGVQLFQYNSLDIQTEKAKQCVEQQEYDKAIIHYSRALEISNDDVSIMFKLAEVYFLKNNKIEYEYLLREIINSSNATQEQIESAYGKLIAIYRARQDFESINDLLMESNNEYVISAYQKYVAMSPEFSIEEGYYTDVQPLKLTAYGNGKIYYTLDGSTPDESSEQYFAPIILDNGKHTINAYFVNEYGIASEIVSKTYQIEIEYLPKPSINALSGDYSIPTFIEISENNEDIYYTTDGSIPTISSTLYTGPIPMPLGKSNYKFIRIEGGRTSEVVDRTYNLVLNTSFTIERAENVVVDYSLESGKIYNSEGNAYYTSDMYKYQFQYTVNINDEGHYYVISEIVYSEDGTQTKTGNHFALDVYNGRFFKLLIDEDNNYTLVEIEEQS